MEYYTHNDLFNSEKRETPISHVISFTTPIQDVLHDDSKRETENFTIDEDNISSISPNIWGPKFWYILHNGASSYSNNPSEHNKERMKGFIKGIPYMLPCESCFKHALSYIENTDVDKIVSNKNELFLFFWEFHNDVNKRIGKQITPLSKAKKKWNMI